VSKQVYVCDYCGKNFTDEPRAAGEFESLCPKCFGDDRWKRNIEAGRVCYHLRNFDAGFINKAFRGRPLLIGDPDQVAVIRALNGANLYCDVCGHVIPTSAEYPDVETVGTACPELHCPGHLMPGAAITPAWKEYAGIEGVLA